MESQVISGFNLSPGQKRLWFLQQESTVYNTQGVFSLRGDLQINHLKRTLEHCKSSRNPQN